MQKIIMLSLCFLGACAYIEKAKELQESPSPKIAQVKQAILYKKDIESLVPSKISQEDSTNVIERFVDAWVRKQLLYQEASNELDSDTEMASIEQRVAEYRQQLVLYAYEKQYIEKNMDTIVSTEQTKQYYNEFPESFVLNNAIFKGIFIKILKTNNRIAEFKTLLQSNSKDDFEKLKSNAVLLSSQYSIEENKWIDLEPVLAGSPFAQKLANRQLPKGFVETEDQAYLYLLKIKQIRFSGEKAPIDFAENMIKDIILSKRKVDLQKQLEDLIFEKATQNKDYEIFRN